MIIQTSLLNIFLSSWWMAQVLMFILIAFVEIFISITKFKLRELKYENIFGIPLFIAGTITLILFFVSLLS